VRWRRGYQGLGFDFTRALMKQSAEGMKVAVCDGGGLLSRFTDAHTLRVAQTTFLVDADPAMEVKVHQIVALAFWLKKYETRPTETAGPFGVRVT
jgi:hypothetical protein